MAIAFGRGFDFQFQIALFVFLFQWPARGRGGLLRRQLHGNVAHGVIGGNWRICYGHWYAGKGGVGFGGLYHIETHHGVGLFSAAFGGHHGYTAIVVYGVFTTGYLLLIQRANVFGPFAAQVLYLAFGIQIVERFSGCHGLKGGCHWDGLGGRRLFAARHRFVNKFRAVVFYSIILYIFFRFNGFGPGFAFGHFKAGVKTPDHPGHHYQNQH